jgi:NAD(P)-dependent dehydrogenase (short-subunit alcohol dehydrogenase family)
MCNAGVVACPKGQSKDGFEIQFATNHLGHALLIKLLLPTLRKTAELHGDARIISLTSPGFAFSPKGGIQFNTLHSAQDLGFGGPPKRYGQSKLANILYADELSRQNPQLTCISIDPGAARTELFTSQGWLMRTFILVSTWLRGERMWSAEHGAYNQLWAATVPRDELPVNGGLYKPIGKHVTPKGYLTDVTLREMLWDWTDRELKEYSL